MTETIYLKDYTPPAFFVDAVHLTFHLHPTATRVLSEITFLRNADAPGPLRLNGEGLTLIRAAIDGVALPEHEMTDAAITIDGELLADRFTWQAEVEIDPASNTSLNGLYMSKGMYCTQCEAEGFRKITYYPDRPDVMAPFSVTIHGDMPVQMSNGNFLGQTATGSVNQMEWHDPFPKPSYLFALVAGDLVSHDDRFTTMSGRDVSLRIWVRQGDEDKCAYAMDALKRSMVWDEQVYGREYDLDLFQIVAVDDFNMGAMENKGLNIFNSKYVLASPETATDTDYALIEGIIAHEYFHNWTGNRITCRDWFQLSLKEGLTVYRDQMFSGDQRGHAVRRIGEVQQLRARQFREDAGPLAHPVRPASYKEINNFYTATVYEKGAEVISMLRNLVGGEGYRKALDLYFDRHDGQACTIEDWLQVFTEATGRDLGQFKRWYEQSGTPRVEVSEDWQDGTYTLTFRQSNPPTPGQDQKEPQVIPIATGLLSPNGDEVQETEVLELTKAEQSFSFKGLSARPIPSLLRNFSAPVILKRSVTARERAFLLAHDTDPFNKWEAGQALARDLLVDMILDDARPDAGFLGAMHRVAMDESQEPAFRALALRLPGEDDLAETLHSRGFAPDPTAIHQARRALSRAIAMEMGEDLSALYQAMAVAGPYTPEAAAAGKRSLRSTALALLTHRDGPDQAQAAFKLAGNMTESLSALTCLVSAGAGEAALRDFYDRWQDNDLVLDKWFGLQASLAPPETAVAAAEALVTHPKFDWKTPNRFRSVIGGFAMMNPAGFHDPSGAGYRFLADWLIRLDPVNPQTTARMSTAFETWRRYDEGRRALVRAELARIAATDGLSRDLGEMIERMAAD